MIINLKKIRKKLFISSILILFMLFLISTNVFASNPEYDIKDGGRYEFEYPNDAYYSVRFDCGMWKRPIIYEFKEKYSGHVIEYGYEAGVIDFRKYLIEPDKDYIVSLYDKDDKNREDHIFRAQISFYGRVENVIKQTEIKDFGEYMKPYEDFEFKVKTQPNIEETSYWLYDITTPKAKLVDKGYRTHTDEKEYVVEKIKRKYMLPEREYMLRMVNKWYVRGKGYEGSKPVYIRFETKKLDKLPEKPEFLIEDGTIVTGLHPSIPIKPVECDEFRYSVFDLTENKDVKKWYIFSSRRTEWFTYGLINGHEYLISMYSKKGAVKSEVESVKIKYYIKNQSEIKKLWLETDKEQAKIGEKVFFRAFLEMQDGSVVNVTDVIDFVKHNVSHRTSSPRYEGDHLYTTEKELKEIYMQVKYDHLISNVARASIVEKVDMDSVHIEKDFIEIEEGASNYIDGNIVLTYKNNSTKNLKASDLSFYVDSSGILSLKDLRFTALKEGTTKIKTYYSEDGKTIEANPITVKVNKRIKDKDVDIVNINNGDLFEKGETIDVMSEFDSSKIKFIRYYIKNEETGEVENPGFISKTGEVSIDTSSLKQGKYTLTVKGYSRYRRLVKEKSFKIYIASKNIDKWDLEKTQNEFLNITLEQKPSITKSKVVMVQSETGKRYVFEKDIDFNAKPTLKINLKDMIEGNYRVWVGGLNDTNNIIAENRFNIDINFTNLN